MENGQIYAAISAAMADISAIGKDKYNQQQGFKFRGIDDVMNALKPILTKTRFSLFRRFWSRREKSR